MKPILSILIYFAFMVAFGLVATMDKEPAYRFLAFCGGTTATLIFTLYWRKM